MILAKRIKKKKKLKKSLRIIEQIDLFLWIRCLWSMEQTWICKVHREAIFAQLSTMLFSLDLSRLFNSWLRYSFEIFFIYYTFYINLIRKSLKSISKIFQKGADVQLPSDYDKPSILDIAVLKDDPVLIKVGLMTVDLRSLSEQSQYDFKWNQMNLSRHEKKEEQLDRFNSTMKKDLDGIKQIISPIIL